MKTMKQEMELTSPRVLVVIFPHPDDETMATGGLIIEAKKAGWRVVVVCLTRGGASKMHIHPNGWSTQEVREKELRRAARILGADEVVIDNYDDGKLRYERAWTGRVGEVIDNYRPWMVATYDPSGYYGHPDHIAVAKEVWKVWMTGKRDFKLMFVAVPEEFRRSLPLRGMAEVKDQMTEATHGVNFGWGWVAKWRAARAHASQGLGKSVPVPLWLFMAKFHYEYYHLVSKNGKYKFGFSDYKI